MKYNPSSLKLIGIFRQERTVIFVFQKHQNNDVLTIEIPYQFRSKLQRNKAEHKWRQVISRLEMDGLDKKKVRHPHELFTWASLNGIDIGSFDDKKFAAMQPTNGRKILQ